MKSALTLDPCPEWLQDKKLASVMEALGPQNALLVGGAVRAAILNEPIGDIDIATNLTPDEVMAHMAKAGIKTVPTGIDHGTVTTVIGKQTFEITTLRQDVQTDGRHAEVAFSKDWVQDAKRRDFTINTLLMDLDGHIYDPTHQGLEDLKNGLVRFVGNPGRRITEDYLRILRFFRFHARYGKGRPDLEGVRAAIRAAEHVKSLSRERVTQEYEKILLGKGAAEVLEQLHEYDILPGIIADGFDHGAYRTLQKIIAQHPDIFDSKLLFAYSVWQNDAESLIEKLEKIFSLSNALKGFLIKNISFVQAQPDSINKNQYRFGRDMTLSGTVLFHVLKDKNSSLEKLEILIEQILASPVPVFPVNGNDVAQLLGIMPGKEMGDVLRKTEEWWLSEDTKPGRAQLLDRLRESTVKYPETEPEQEAGSEPEH